MLIFFGGCVMKLKSIIGYFSKGEIFLWSFSVIVIIISFYFFNSESYLTLAASLIGVTSLIFNAKGNPVGQFLMVIFSLFYGVISFDFSYYGEMITYLGMTMPMAVFALITWMRNPYNGNKAEVQINYISKKETSFMFIIAIFVTAIFYFVLKALNTSNIILSTVSVTTSFVAVYLTIKRNPYYAIGYVANDIVLIFLWILASIENFKYLSVVVCFITFIANDIYGYINWRKIGKKQAGN